MDTYRYQKYISDCLKKVTECRSLAADALGAGNQAMHEHWSKMAALHQKQADEMRELTQAH